MPRPSRARSIIASQIGKAGLGWPEPEPKGAGKSLPAPSRDGWPGWKGDGQNPLAKQSLICVLDAPIRRLVILILN